MHVRDQLRAGVLRDLDVILDLPQRKDPLSAQSEAEERYEEDHYFFRNDVFRQCLVISKPVQHFVKKASARSDDEENESTR